MDFENGRNLIFLIGQPRSGTTLLQTLLGQHPDIFTHSESWVLLPSLFALKEGKLIAPAYGAQSCTWAIEDLLEKSGGIRDTYIQAVRKLTGVLYGSCLKASGKKLFLDKSPPYYSIMLEIAELFPEAKIVVLLRNPLAVLSSITETWFEGQCSLILNHPVHINSIFVAPIAIANGIRVLENRCYVIRYEDLVTSPEREMRALCEYIGIQYSNQMLSYEIRDQFRGRLGDPIGVTRYTKPSELSLHKWHLTFRDYANYTFAMSYIEYLGSNLFSFLGYDYDATKKAIVDAWGRHSFLETVSARVSYWMRAVRSSIKALIVIRHVFEMEWAISWGKYYFKFPPAIPDFSLLEQRWQTPASLMLRPKISLSSYWPEVFELFKEWRSEIESR